MVRGFRRPKLRKLRHSAIDEIRIGKRHTYLTVVMDLKTGAVVFVGDGKGAGALEPFWKRLRCSRATVKGVAMDMSPAYRSAVTNHLPDAALVFDHFYVIKRFNDKLSDLRRPLYYEVNDILQKQVMKGTRWPLLKNPEHRDPSKNEPLRLQQALEINQPLPAAYCLKEDLRQLRNQPDKGSAQSFLSNWIDRVRDSDIKMLIRFANTLAAHKTGLLNDYDFTISPGALEGANNPSKTLQKQAYGFRDLGFFKLKMMAVHEEKHALAG